MEYGFTIAAYAVAAVLFILSLGGLSGQESGAVEGELVDEYGSWNKLMKREFMKNNEQMY